MFLGQFETTFSGKNEQSSSSNRIILPKKFRNELKEATVYIIEGYDGGIWGFGVEEWAKEVKKRLAEELTSAKGRLERRIFFSSAESCVLDGQGRFIIPEVLVVRAGLKEQILIIGAGDHFEIWNPDFYQKVLKSYGSTTGT